MAPLAQKLGLALLLALSIASLGLSIPMFFTLRLLRTSVANKCTPGGGCSVPAWVRGSPEEGVLVWDSMETARLAEINRHWIPLTYAYITYSALTLIYLATYLYTHIAASLRNTWTSLGCDVIVQFILGACGIAVATLQLMVRWSYGWFDADIFAPRVCEELGPYCPHLRANFAVALALGSLLLLASISQVLCIQCRHVSFGDSLASVPETYNNFDFKTSQGSIAHIESCVATNGSSSATDLVPAPDRRQSRQLHDAVVLPHTGSPTKSSCQTSGYRTATAPGLSSQPHSLICGEIGPHDSHTPSSNNSQRLTASSDVGKRDSNRLSTGRLTSAPGAPVPGNPSQPKRPSRLRESVIYSADEPDLDLGPKYLEPVRDHDTPSDSSSDMLSSPAITITRASSSSHGHDPLTSSTPLHGTLGHQSRSDTSHGWRSRPSSHASNPGRPSSAAVFAALDDLQEVLAAPQLTPEVIQSLQNRIAVFHLLARPAEQASPFSDGSPSTPTRPALAGAPKFLDPMPRRSLPVRGRHGRV